MRLARFRYLPPMATLCAIAAAPLAPTQAPAQVAPPQLSQPVQCVIGRDCEIQNYVDRDPSPAAKDYQCGGRTYQGHNGVDFRIPTLARQKAGVAVLAAADGRVLRVRDGVADISVAVAGVESVRDRECGNGVVIGHGPGWETQYCHLAQGSVGVQPGETVRAGDPIGRIGLSGQTEYPHLHFSVRENGEVVDPFAYGAPPGACNAGRNLWRPEVRAALVYKPRSVLNTGFATQAVTMDFIEAGDAPAPGESAPALVAFARAIGLKAGDVQELTLTGPSGQELARNRAQPLPRDQAQNMVFTGVRRPAQGWAKGRYRAAYSVKSQGRTVLSQEFETVL